MHKHDLLSENILKKIIFIVFLCAGKQAWSTGPDYICSIQRVISSHEDTEAEDTEHKRLVETLNRVFVGKSLPLTEKLG